MIPRLVLAAPASGSGKTTVTLAIMAALRRRGLRVAPFKVGPDYIDPQFHERACNRAGYNLDRFFLGVNGIRRTFARGSRDAEIAIIEGVMGLFDGSAPTGIEGSTADLAAIIRAPVILIIDAAGMAQSVAALVRGFRDFDPETTIAGVILNRLKSRDHLEYLLPALAAEKIPVIGFFPHDSNLALPERHLGLVPPPEYDQIEPLLDRLANAAEKTLDLNQLIEVAQGTYPSESIALPAAASRRRMVRIGWAEDEVFSFSYRENKDLLEEAGAEIIPFSPLHDRALPAAIDALWIGGGFPEIFAEALGQNRSMIEAIRAFGDNGGVVHAECGGFIYLCEWFERRDKARLPLVGLFAGGTRMTERLQSFGYAEARFLRDLPFGPAETSLRGHRFHYSEYVPPPTPAPSVLAVQRSGSGRIDEEGFLHRNAFASYFHFHLGSAPETARRFVEFVGTSAGQ